MAAPPTSSQSYAWNPALADVIIAAYGRCQIRRTSLTVDHLADAAMAANLLQVEWSNEQVNLWTVDLQTIPLQEGVSVYDVDPGTMMIMAAYISTEQEPEKHRIITSIDRDSYAGFPNKETPGRPTTYWFDQQVQPQITIWQPPDENGPYTLKFYRARRMQDALLPNGLLPEVPYQFLEAYVAGLAFKLSILYAPGRTSDLGNLANYTFTRAKQRDVEDSSLRIVPAMTTYTSMVY